MGRTTRLACRRAGTLLLRLLLLVGAVALAPALPALAAAGAASKVAGAATAAAGRVVALRGDAARTIAARGEVLEGDLIETGEGSTVSVRFGDGSLLSLAPGTRASIDRFAFDPLTGRGVLAIDVLAGGFEFVSGGMNKEGYAIRTPFAAMALRGTHITVDVGNESILTLEGEVVARFLTGETLSLKPSECTFRAAGARTRSSGITCGESFAALSSVLAAARAQADALGPDFQLRLPSPDKGLASPN